MVNGQTFFITSLQAIEHHFQPINQGTITHGEHQRLTLFNGIGNGAIRQTEFEVHTYFTSGTNS